MCVQKCPLSHGDLRLFGFDIIDKVTNDWQPPRRRQFAFYLAALGLMMMIIIRVKSKS